MTKEKSARPLFARLLRLAAILGALVLLAIAALWFWPLGLDRLAPPGEPVTWDRYLASLSQADEGDLYRDICHSTYLPGADDNRDVVILLHGLTNCPEQFRVLGEQIVAASGRHVLIPRIPFHGESDLMTDSLKNLTADVLVSVADQASRAAKDHGGRVSVIGLSLGADMAAWIAQHHDIDQALVIAPIVGIPGFSPRLARPVTNMTRLMPNTFEWWDPKLRENLPGPDYVYPRYSAFGTGQLLRLGLHLERAAAETPPACRSITVVSNVNDKAVNQDSVDRLVKNWKKHAPDRVDTYLFTKKDGPGHDLIDPHQTDADIAFVYPIILDLLLNP